MFNLSICPPAMALRDTYQGPLTAIFSSILNRALQRVRNVVHT
jgi:hypothetical protein